MKKYILIARKVNDNILYLVVQSISWNKVDSIVKDSDDRDELQRELELLTDTGEDENELEAQYRNDQEWFDLSN